MVALGAAMVGGACLVGNLFVGSDPLGWAGLGLIGLALAVLGAGLVRQAWLSPICAAGALALGWAVLEIARAAAPERQLHAVLGGGASLCVAVVTMRRPAAAERPGNHRG